MPLVLVGVRDREGDLGTVAVVSREPRDRDRRRIALEIGNERVVRAVDGGELLELGLCQAGLRAVEAGAARLVAELLEDGAHGRDVALPRGRTRIVGPCLILITRVCMSRVGKTYPTGLEKSTLLWHTAMPRERIRPPAPARSRPLSACSVRNGRSSSSASSRSASTASTRSSENTGAPRDILTSRLRRLEAEGVLEKRQYMERPVRFDYHLTPAGDELRPILLSLAQWGERWTTQEPTTAWVHSCGAEVELVHTCKACGGEVTGLDLKPRRVAASAA